LAAPCFQCTLRWWRPVTASVQQNDSVSVHLCSCVVNYGTTMRLQVEKGAIVAAGALVTPGTVVPSGEPALLLRLASHGSHSSTNLSQQCSWSKTPALHVRRRDGGCWCPCSYRLVTSQPAQNQSSLLTTFVCPSKQARSGRGGRRSCCGSWKTRRRPSSAARRTTTRCWRAITRSRTPKPCPRWSWTRRAGATDSCGIPTTTATWACRGTRRHGRSSRRRRTPRAASSRRLAMSGCQRTLMTESRWTFAGRMFYRCGSDPHCSTLQMLRRRLRKDIRCNRLVFNRR